MITAYTRRVILSFTAVLLLAASLLSLLPAVKIGAEAEALGAVKNVTNLVVFVRFSDDAEDIVNSGNNLSEIIEMFDNNADPSFQNIDSSFKHYIETVSNGRLLVDNSFPQLSADGTTLSLLTLSQPRADMDDYYVLQEVIAAFGNEITAEAGVRLDNLESGVIDNLTVILQGSNGGMSDGTMYPHKGVAFNEGTISGSLVRNYNFIDTGSLLDSMQKQGVISHEFLHSMGLPDLYRYSGKGMPVGRWDLMASVGMYQQYPLSYSRRQLGWIDIDTLTQSGSVTLKPVTASEDCAIILTTPQNDTEIFVVEYRKKLTDTMASLGFETKIPGSGIIVYRVNTMLETNAGGADYIYVFRPNETGLTDSAGDIDNAWLSAESGRTSMGSADLSASFTDGTIFYSDGTNSGIVISEVGSAGDTISFKVSYPDYSSLGLWDKAGGTLSSDSSSINIAASDSGVIYSAWDSGYSVHASKYENGAWSSLGSAINNAYSPALAVLGETPYLLYCNSSGIAVLAKWSGSSWSTVKSFSGIYPNKSDIFVSGGVVYVCFSESNSLKAYRMNGSTAEQLGTAISGSYISNAQIAVLNGDVYLLYSDYFASDKSPKLVKLDSGAWTQLDAFTLSSSKMHELEVFGGKLYAAAANDTAGVAPEIALYDGSTISRLSFDGLGDTAISSMALSWANGHLCVGVSSASGAAVYERLNDAWTKLGGSVSTTGYLLDICSHNNYIYALVSASGAGKLDVYFKAASTGGAPAIEYDLVADIRGGASKLYEPWGLRYFATFTGDDADKITQRGIAILKEDYYTDAMSAESFVANANAHVYTGDELGFVEEDGAYYATLTEGIYSYDIDAYYYVVPFAEMPDSQVIYGAIERNSMENILTTNLGLDSITDKEKAICRCILDLKDSAALHYAESGISEITIDMSVPRGSSQTAAASVKTSAETGVAPNVVSGASRLIEPWGLRYFASYANTGANTISEYGMVILKHEYYSDSFAASQDLMRLSENAYVYRSGDGTLKYDADTGRYYGTITEGISSKDISDSYYVVPFVVLSDGSYVYGSIKVNSMLRIMEANLLAAGVPETEKELSRDIIALYRAVESYYA